MSIYDELGGDAGVKAAVTVLYARVLADETLAPYFAGIDVGRLRAHQRAFIAAAVGGPELFTGRRLEEAHHRLEVDDAAFDRLLDHLAAALGDTGADASAVAAVRERVEGMRARVVGAS